VEDLGVHSMKDTPSGGDVCVGVSGVRLVLPPHILEPHTGVFEVQAQAMEGNAFTMRLPLPPARFSR